MQRNADSLSSAGRTSQFLDSGLENANVPYSYGFSIILLTLLVKLATFPLSKQQVESTMAMQVQCLSLSPSPREDS